MISELFVTYVKVLGQESIKEAADEYDAIRVMPVTLLPYPTMSSLS